MRALQLAMPVAFVMAFLASSAVVSPNDERLEARSRMMVLAKECPGTPEHDPEHEPEHEPFRRM